ncbi:putative oxidoreductase [Tribonema minus]|uniref:Putative oxidoreductase n=1 Tax=Tribonema minus TaxID=303371 RepID=A0A836C9S2_9STRA|nr:putative oxidoreductase [Tribonema minus]
MADQTTMQNPKTQYPEEVQRGEGTKVPYPGITSEMREKPDHGEKSYKGLGRLKDKRAIITGGDSGIGRAVALAFAREGADIMISCYEEEEKDALETAQLVKDAGRKCIIVPGDIRHEDRCKGLAERCVRELGGIDILVNNAAYQMEQQNFIDITTEQFDRTMKTNMYAMFWLTKYAVPHMAPGSTIINTSSVEAFRPDPFLLDYAMTKAAIVNFTKSLGQSLIDKGIRVNSVAPGPVWTPFVPATMSEGNVAGFGKAMTPMGRPAQPAELAPPFVFLASQESSYITAETLAVTGGMLIT